MHRTARSRPAGAAPAIAVAAALLAMLLPTLGTPAAQGATSSRAAVATSFVRAMARHDIGAAARLVRSTTPRERAALLSWNEVWSHATSATCRGVICYPDPWLADPASGLLMRKVNGRWWVAGLVAFPSLGPGRVVGTKQLYDGSGRRASFGPPQGVSYWKLRETDPNDAAYARVTRKGNRVSIVVRSPQVVRLHPAIAQCIRGTIDRSGVLRAQRATTNLPWDGYVSRDSVTGPVWRWGRTLELWDVVDLYGWGSELVSREWARSTSGRTGGSAWASARAACTRAG